jgi:subtilisin
MSLERNISKFGYTRAVIFTKTKDAKKNASLEPRRIEEMFSTSFPNDTKVSLNNEWKERPYRYFESLGVYFGIMDNKGLKGSQETGINVYFPQTPTFIRPVGGRLAMAAGPSTYGLEMLGIEDIWKTGLDGKGVKVGHLDTGIDPKHPALRGKLEAWIDTNLRDGDIIQDGRPPEEAAYDEIDNPPFTVSHGTHTAGTIAGGLTNGMAIGVAPGCRLCSGKVIEGNPVPRVLTGLEWIIKRGCRVLGMSLGFQGDDDTWDRLIESLRANGVVPCIAAGNEGENSIRSPGSSPGALTVGAIDSNKRVADFSSSMIVQGKSLPEYVCPGVGVQSAKNGGGLQEMDGTSMATPHVAGVAAILVQAYPDATVDQIEQAITNSCEELPPPEIRERYGNGLVSPTRALEYLKNNS